MGVGHKFSLELPAGAAAMSCIMDRLRGQELKAAFSAATDRMEEFRDAVNALNVFPVPDGDTGTNMLLTMQAAMEAATRECPDCQEHSVASVSSSLAQGAFFGARGNSGVILSQFFKGFSDALDGKKFLTTKDLPLAFKLASEGAYHSVGSPAEGTMLTVFRKASEAIQGEDSDLLGLWETAYIASQVALERTPEQLPVLQESGVVDAGGFGVVILIGSILRCISGSTLDLSELSRFQGADHHVGSIRPEYLDGTTGKEWGFCTQLIISRVNGRTLDLEQIRNHFEETALSTVVVGDQENVRVHIHVEDPAPAIRYAESYGSVSDLKIENMDSQNEQFANNGHASSSEGLALALLPVAQGQGLAHLFRDSGCAGVIAGGQTMNPSVQQILDAARATGAKDVIILPNNNNIILAAERAADADPSIHVVPTKSLPQGVTALLAFNPEGPWQENVESMSSAISKVVSVEVTTATRGVNINGLGVAEGQYIGILDGELAIVEDISEIALRSTLSLAGLSSDAIVTVYCGVDRTPSDAASLAAELEKEFPGIQVDIIEGGQPYHQYLASVE
jgi:hypothetical protein